MLRVVCSSAWLPPREYCCPLSSSAVRAHTRDQSSSNDKIKKDNTLILVMISYAYRKERLLIVSHFVQQREAACEFFFFFSFLKVLSKWWTNGGKQQSQQLLLCFWRCFCRELRSRQSTGRAIKCRFLPTRCTALLDNA